MKRSMESEMLQLNGRPGREKCKQKRLMSRVKI